MNKKYKHSINRSVYMPEELISRIQEVADEQNSNFNKMLVDVLLKEFLEKQEGIERRNS